MNQLSWLIYVANICGNMGFPLGLLALLSFMSLIALIGFTIVQDVEARDNVDEAVKYLRRSGDVPTEVSNKLAEYKNARNPFRFWAFVMSIWFVVSLTLAVLCPARETVYAIAASEMGEQALKTPTVDKAFKALDAWLDKQITPPPAPLEPAE